MSRIFIAIVALVEASSVFAGPLQVDPVNPRYFTDGSGRAIFLTGSHTVTNFQDDDRNPNFDFTGYLNFLITHGHNYIRLWQLDIPKEKLTDNPISNIAPLPYKRTGPGRAADGGLKFDLRQLDQFYFDRLRARVVEAGKRGVYVSCELFDGWWVTGDNGKGWSYSPHNSANNVNGVLASATHVYTTDNSTWLTYTDAYVDKVVDTLNDLDNVLYQIINEAPAATNTWQEHIVDRIHARESGMAKHHPVGRGADDYKTSDANCNANMVTGHSDFVSLSGRSENPPNSDYKTHITPAPEIKVSILDTDHIWGVAPQNQDNSPWVWKCFTRGHNPIYFDPFTYSAYRPDPGVRAAMGYARTLADRIDLKHMPPAATSTSTGYALVNPNTEYVVYQPANASFTVNLPAQKFNIEWINPLDGTTTNAGSINATLGNNSFSPPPGHTKGAVLHLKSPSSG